MEDKIDNTLAYYYHKRNEILNFINTNDCLVPDQIIEKGEELAVLEYKITALQIAKEN
ncbi:hypothetical protein [Jejuia spongiicola]|uniref:Uncharacterized protein n=1 Tax=Jejuia spongiicola TaxID=2942207 RepID=A0ABT0QJ69_9FLAO|nr:MULTISPECIES: hypothetical protein [Flavobacteriaceae]MCL6296329.1 hypothetical protein [Jejuia spongiicola]